MSRDQLQQQQWTKLHMLLQKIAVTPGFQQDRLSRAGIHAAQIDSLPTFLSLVPPTTKAEILANHQQHPPFGNNQLFPPDQYTRFCQTSGTSTGQPMAWLDTADSWNAMLDCWQRVFTEAGLKAGSDRIFFAFSFGPFLGFWTAFEAAARDYLVIPGGGLSSQARLQAMARYGATTLCCTPTYALRLGQQIGAASGVQLADLSVRTLIVAGEPGGSLPPMRAQLESLWNARILDHHGMTEVGPVSYESPAHPATLIIMEEAYLAEIVDPHSGSEVAPGDCGELWLTTLTRQAAPLLRYRTGDWVQKAYLGHRLALPGGVLCRIDDMLVLRGVNVYPSAIESIVRQLPGIAEFQVHTFKKDQMAELMIRVEPQPDAWPDAAALRQRLESTLRDTLTIRIPVQICLPNSLPRHEFKSQRWIASPTPPTPS
jgi:phenylacetate-CoA ligase